MALYPSRPYSRRRHQIRMWSYIILGLVVVALIVVYVYKGKHREAAADVESKPELVAVEPFDPVEKAMVELPSEATVEPDANVAELIDEAMKYLEAGPDGIIDARTRLNEALPMPMSREQRAFIKEQLSKLADKWLFSRTIFPRDELCGSYRVKPGEVLSTISRRFMVPHEILMEINNIHVANALQAGETIKIIEGPFHARVYRSTFTMDLYLQNTFVRSFRVGLGKPGMETPTGLWIVKPDGKLIAPTWTDPVSGKTHESEDPDYPLGSRWIGLEGIEGNAKGRTGFAIHGTKSPEEIGTPGSQGCIRLHNGDAILVYNLLMPGISKVQVVE